MRPPLAFASLLLALVAAPVAAQGETREPVACASATGPDTGSVPPRDAMRGHPASALARDTAHAALRILASVSAAEVRFVGSPKVCVRLTGDARLDAVRVTARRNLATPVVSNTTYRDVYVAVEIVGRLNAECIAGRITGAAADSASAARCASLQARGTGGRP